MALSVQLHRDTLIVHSPPAAKLPGRLGGLREGGILGTPRNPSERTYLLPRLSPHLLCYLHRPPNNHFHIASPPRKNHVARNHAFLCTHPHQPRPYNWRWNNRPHARPRLSLIRDPIQDLRAALRDAGAQSGMGVEHTLEFESA